MAKRNSKFLLKRSNTPGKVPLPGDLLLGELALNTSDVILYTSGTTANQILPIGWDRLSITGGTVTGNVTVNGNITSSGLTLTNITNATGDILTIDSNNIIKKRTISEILSDIGAVPTSRTITINSGDGLTGGAAQNLGANRTWNLAVDSTVVRTSGNQTIGGTKTFSSTIVGSINGNASTATTLQTARTLTIGNTGKTFNGGASVSWSLAEIGAQAALTNPVTGTGTTNFLPKFTGATTLGNSLVFDNGTNVGIGTTTPSEKLEVQGSILIEGTSSNNRLRLGASIGQIFSLGTFFNGSFDSMFIEYSALGTGQIITLQGNGNVGIGTTTPNAKLEVSADILVNSITVGRGAGNIDTNTAVGQSALTNNTTGFQNTAVGRNALANNTTGINNTAVGQNALVNNTTGGSNIGLGFDAGRRISNGNNQTITNNSIFIGRDTRALADNQTNQIVIGHEAVGVGSNSVVLGNDSITKTILKGDVGIGTTSPSTNLHVVGNGLFTGTLEVDTVNNGVGDFLTRTSGGIITRRTAAEVRTDIGAGTGNGTVTSITAGDGLSGGAITTSGTIAVDGTVVRTTGNQTIGGTKTFSSTIAGSINGNAATATTLQTARTLTIGNTGKTFNGGADVSWSLAEIGAQAALTNPITGTGSSGQVSFFNGTTTQTSDNGLFWDNSNKRLGIGTTNPQANLHINSSGNVSYLHLTNIVSGPGINNGMTIGINSSNYFIFVREASPLYFATDSTERMRITSTGDVGIGTTLPSTNLHVVGNGLFTGTLKVDTVNNGVGDFLTKTSGGIITKRTAAEVRSDIQASQYFTVSSGSWIPASTSGWFRLASTSGNQRGSVRIILSFIGGNFAPQNYIIDVTKDWTTVASLRVDVRTAQTRWITGVRVIQDTVNTSVYHLEANFASSSNPYEFRLTFDDAYGFNSTWTMATTAPLVASTNGTVILSKDIFLSGDYSTDLINTGNINISGNTLSSIDTNGNIILSPNGSGNVGIGTTSPSQKLHVVGNGLFTGTLEVDTVNNGVGDFLTRTSGGIITRRTAAEVRTDIGAGTGNGTITSITAGDGLSGGAITTSGTIAVDSTVVRTSGNQTIGGTKTFSSTIVGSINGNASTATTLQNARTINGTSFNGSANITTANWGTARTLTIGSTGKSVNGSGNVSWSLAEIGAEPAFTKNTAFNKNFGTTAGTVAEGNDSRILNGQTAFGWGNHAIVGYAINGTGGTQVRNNTQLDARYLQANQTITLSGVVTGSGTTAITTSIANGAISNAMIANSSFHVGTTLISLGRASAGQTLTGVSIDGTALNVTGTVAIANGGTGATTAAGARTNLGATTVGSNIFTLVNPSAVRFIRINADNTISALDATAFRTAIGAGTSSTNGTVTSVSASAGTGISITGSPITTSGTLTITNTAPHIATNLGTAVVATNSRSITSSTGNDITVPVATTVVAGFMSHTDKSKLDGIAAGAQVNVATNLGITAGTTAGPIITSSTGTNATLPTATGTASGVVTTGAQTWAGVKTFSSTIVGSINGNASTATTWQTARTLTIGNTGKSVNGSGDVSWSLAEIGAQAALTNPVTGTGTTNFLSKFTGATTLGNSLVFDNGTNVGIGTTSPAFKLHVLGTGAGDSTFTGGVLIDNNNANDGEPTLAFRVNSMVAGGNYWFTGLNQTNNYSIAYGTSFTDINTLFRVQNNGNVGIGTTSPSTKLHVVGNGLFTGTLEVDTVNNGVGDFLTRTSGGIITRRTAAEVRTDIGAGTGNGTVTSITAGDGLSGGAITTSGTIAVDSTVVRTSGNQTIGGTKTFSSTIVGSINGNAATATTLQTARTINGTSFNGSTNITTANWGTARTLTIGATGKSVNGSGNVSWSLAEIGAAATSHTHTASQISNSTTVGQNLITLTNPGAITFLRVNANNTVDALSAANFRTAIGAGTGTLSSVNLGYTAAATNGVVTNTAGNNATIPAATTSLAGLMTNTDKSKLDGIAAGAQVNVGTNLGITAGTTAGPIVTSSTGTNATLPTASASASGVVTTGNQTWSGTKTFSSTIVGSINGNAATATTATNLNRQVIAGNGLTGGGTLDANRTLTVGAGSGISVSSTAVAVDGTVVRTTGNQTIGGVKTFTSNILVNNTILSNQENLDVDTGALRLIAQISSTNHDAVFFDYVIKKGNDLRAGTVYAVHNGTDVEFTETSTNDIGNTNEVVLTVDISGGNVRLLAKTDTNDWQIKTLVRGI